MSVRLWNFKLGPKKQDFWPRIKYSKENIFKKCVDELRFIKKCQNPTYKSQCQKSTDFFQKKFHLRISI